MHYNVRIPCDQSNYIAMQVGILKHHKGWKERCVRYPCDSIATQAEYLKHHKESKHEGLRYSCDEIATSLLFELHKTLKRGDVRYPCNQFDCIATTSMSV